MIKAHVPSMYYVVLWYSSRRSHLRNHLSRGIRFAGRVAYIIVNEMMRKWSPGDTGALVILIKPEVLWYYSTCNCKVTREREEGEKKGTGLD